MAKLPANVVKLTTTPNLSSYARLSFPTLFNPEFKLGYKPVGNPDVDAKHQVLSATFLVSKEDKVNLAAIATAKAAFLKEKFGDDIPKGIVDGFMDDGDTKDYEGYAGHWAIKGRNTIKFPPRLVNRDGVTPVTQHSGVFRDGGDYVIAYLVFWFSPKGTHGDTRYPAQLLCNINTVQWCKEGEKFGSAPVDIGDIDAFDDGDF